MSLRYLATISGDNSLVTAQGPALVLQHPIKAWLPRPLLMARTTQRVSMQVTFSSQ